MGKEMLDALFSDLRNRLGHAPPLMPRGIMFRNPSGNKHPQLDVLANSDELLSACLFSL
jgi:hypothetical protein